MNAQKFTQVITKLRELQDEMNEYLERTPTELTTVLVDTPYANAHGLQYDTVLQAFFGPHMVEDVYWFLHDWVPGRMIMVDGVQYIIKDLDDFIAYMVESYAME